MSTRGSGEPNSQLPSMRDVAKQKAVQKRVSTRGSTTKGFLGEAANKMRIAQRAVGVGTSMGSLRDKTIPLQELLVIVFRIQRMKLLKEAVLFFAAIMLFLAVMLSIAVVGTAWSQTNGIKDLLFDEEFPGAQYKKTFHDVMQQEEFFQFLRGPLVDGLWPEAWYNGDELEEGEAGYVLMYNRLVGGVQLRQLRVSGNSCVNRRFNNDGKMNYDTKDGTCYAEFSEAVEDKTPIVGRYMTYEYQTGMSDVTNYDGYGPTKYGTGGHTIFLPANNRTAVVETVNQLYEDRWLDRGTRAVVVDFTLYNTNTRLATVVRVLFEFFESGNVYTSHEINSFRVVFYQSTTSFFRTILEGSFLAMLFLLVVQEFTRAWRFRPHYYYYLRDEHNVMALFFIVLNPCSLYYWYKFISSEERRSFDVNSLEFKDYHPLGNQFRSAMNFAAGVTILSFIKGFRYLSLNQHVYIMWVTLGHATQQLSAFLVIFGIVISSFAVAAMMLFGQHSADFHTFGASVSTLIRWNFGDFDYSELELARPLVSAAFFYPYFILVFMIFFNMLIAIIVQAFETTRATNGQQEAWKEFVPSIIVDISNHFKFKWKTLLHNCSCLFACCKGRKKDRQSLLKKSEEMIELSVVPDELPAPPAALSGGGGARSDSLPSVNEDVEGESGEEPERAPSSFASTEAASWHTAEHKEYMMQQRLWRLVHEAMQIAKRREPPTNIFEYFKTTYDIMRLNSGEGDSGACTAFVSKGEFESIIGSDYEDGELGEISPSMAALETRSNEIVDAIFKTYHQLNEVTMVQALISSTDESHKCGQGEKASNAPKHEFAVEKLNKWGMRQNRTLVIDPEQLDIRVFIEHKSGGRSLRRGLPLMQLVQLEKSRINTSRLRLVFREEVDAADQDYLFKHGAKENGKAADAEARRDEFVSLVLTLVAKAYDDQQEA